MSRRWCQRWRSLTAGHAEEPNPGLGLVVAWEVAGHDARADARRERVDPHRREGRRLIEVVGAVLLDQVVRAVRDHAVQRRARAGERALLADVRRRIERLHDLDVGFAGVGEDAVDRYALPDLDIVSAEVGDRRRGASDRDHELRGVQDRADGDRRGRDGDAVALDDLGDDDAVVGPEAVAAPGHPDGIRMGGHASETGWPRCGRNRGWCRPIQSACQLWSSSSKVAA
jgi:hypothetical protein